MRGMQFFKFCALLVTLCLVISVFSACGSSGSGTSLSKRSRSRSVQLNSSQTSAHQSTAVKKVKALKFIGKILMCAQGYSPVEPTNTNPTPPTMLKTLAKKYSELHPGIEIDFLTGIDGQDYDAWIKTKIAGGMAPDIIWGQWGAFNSGMYPKGSVINLNNYLTKPNPYYTAAATWGDMFYSNIQKQIAGPKGEHYVIDGDYVATCVVYNKDLYKRAGITKLPTNWTKFTQVNKKLLSAGVIPWVWSFGNDSGSESRITWLSRLFYTNFYANDFKKLAVMGSQTRLNAIETLIAYKKGIFGTKDPRFLAWWEVIKNQLPYLQKNCTSAAASNDTIFNMFVNQKTAQQFNATWVGNSLKNAKASFPYGTYPFPSPDAASTKYATKFNSSGAIGGPNAAFQYAIAPQQASQSMTKDKQDACADWLMYISTPENNSAICNELGSFVPIVKGAKQLPGNEAIIKLFQTQPLSIDCGIGSVLSQTVLDAYYRTFQQYIVGKVTLADAAKILQPIIDQDVDTQIAALKIDISPYMK